MEASDETFEPTTGTPAGAAEGAPTPPAGPAPPQDPVTPVAPEPSHEEQLAAEAAAQSPAEPQVVPEQRPQAFVSPDPSQQSETAQRVAESAPGPATEEDFARAQSDEAKKKAADAGRYPNLLVGQRVIITKGDDEGRMGYILNVNYTDAIQQMIAASGSSEAPFAEVEQYQVVTRDGRNDTLYLTADQVKPLEVNQGWGRGRF